MKSGWLFLWFAIGFLFSIFVVLRAYLHGGGLDGEFRAQAGALAHGLKRLLLTPPNTNYTFNG